MFLAIKEIWHSKLHYALITGMVTLIGYLMFMLMGMMLGLANENTAAIKSWDTQTVYLNKNSNVNMQQSLISKQQVNKRTKHQADVGVVPAVITTVGTNKKHKESIQYMGLRDNQYIYQDKLQIVNGRKPKGNNEVVLDQTMKSKGYHVGSKIKLNDSDQTYKVVGLSKNTQFNIAPLVIGSITNWQRIKGVGPQFIASGIFADRQLSADRQSGLAKYPVQKFINKLPGYTAQNKTFEFMIGFLMVISLIIIAVFLYILTLQKKQLYAVLRAQGIPSSTIIGATVSQAVVLMLSGVVIATVLMWITSLVIPNTVPMLINWPLTLTMATALVILGIIGSLLPIRVILRIAPLDAM